MISDLVEKELERIKAKKWADITQEEKNDLLRLVWIGHEVERYTLYSDDPCAMLKSFALRKEDIDLLDKLDPQGTSWVQH